MVRIPSPLTFLCYFWWQMYEKDFFVNLSITDLADVAQKLVSNNKLSLRLSDPILLFSSHPSSEETRDLWELLHFMKLAVMKLLVTAAFSEWPCMCFSGRFVRKMLVLNCSTKLQMLEKMLRWSFPVSFRVTQHRPVVFCGSSISTSGHLSGNQYSGEKFVFLLVWLVAAVYMTTSEIHPWPCLLNKIHVFKKRKKEASLSPPPPK